MVNNTLNYDKLLSRRINLLRFAILCSFKTFIDKRRLHVSSALRGKQLQGEIK